jgi:hypothetical protein
LISEPAATTITTDRARDASLFVCPRPAFNLDEVLAQVTKPHA